MNALLPFLAIVGAYLLGSLSFAVVVSRAMGLSDPRTYGSKNPGATNVLRSGSKPAAVATLLLDAAKGWLPVWAVLGWGAPYGLHESTAAFVGLAAFFGHLWPVFFRFVGGKGVATALGVLVGFSPWLGLAAALVWVLVALITRYSSLAALVAAGTAPVIYLLASGLLWDAQSSMAAVMALMAGLLVWRHKENVARLMAGTESRVGASKKPTAKPPTNQGAAPQRRRKRH